MPDFASVAAAHQASMPTLLSGQKGINITVTSGGVTAEYLKTADGVALLTQGAIQTS